MVGGSGEPASEDALYADFVEVPAALALIEICKEKVPGLLYFIENPTTCAFKNIPPL